MIIKLFLILGLVSSTYAGEQTDKWASTLEWQYKFIQKVESKFEQYKKVKQDSYIFIVPVEDKEISAHIINKYLVTVGQKVDLSNHKEEYHLIINQILIHAYISEGNIIVDLNPVMLQYYHANTQENIVLGSLSVVLLLFGLGAFGFLRMFRA